MKRAQIDQRLQWDLTQIFLTDKDWQKEFDSFAVDSKAIAKYKGKLSQKGKLLECLDLSTTLGKRIYKLHGYAHLKHDSDGSDNNSATMYSKIRSLISTYYASTSFIDSEISSMDEQTINQAIANPDFADYDFYLKEILRQKQHILPEREEKLLVLASKPISGIKNAFLTFNSMDIKFPKIMANGKKEQLTHGKYSQFLTSSDRKTRSNAFKGVYKAYSSMINTIGTLYASSVSADNYSATAKQFDSAIEKALFTTGIPREVYDNLISSVNNNLHIMHAYMSLRREFLGVDRLHLYDMHVSMFKEANYSHDFDEAFDIVVEALKPMGEDYLNTFKKARTERWIDVMENEGKRSGAYMSNVYGVHPYVLLNHGSTVHDTFTIAHEMGHALHSHYSSSIQPFYKHQYEIFSAEIASTVNEVILLKHLLATTDRSDTTKRAFLLSYYLDMFRTTLFRQTMFAEFEKIAHDMDAKGIPLTVKSLSDTYYKLNKKYYGREVACDQEIKYEWARVPHFYTAFYVYQYATGLTAAVNIAKKILTEKGFVEIYKEKFLSAGGNGNAYEILKSIGIDLATPEPFDVAFGEFAETLKELGNEKI